MSRANLYSRQLLVHIIFTHKFKQKIFSQIKKKIDFLYNVAQTLHRITVSLEIY